MITPGSPVSYADREIALRARTLQSDVENNVTQQRRHALTHEIIIPHAFVLQKYRYSKYTPIKITERIKKLLAE